MFKGDDDCTCQFNDCPVHGRIERQDHVQSFVLHSVKSSMKEIAERYRSSNYSTMSPQEQWEEDKRLGILD